MRLDERRVELRPEITNEEHKPRLIDLQEQDFEICGGVVGALVGDLRQLWIWYIGIALKAATSIPRSSTIAATHFGVRPIPLQVSSGFCGLRYLAVCS